ncbi:MAG: YiiX/YebB-like N1pC/P60 family cysteine hydrolase [Hyphomicrobiaceae bacterium]
MLTQTGCAAFDRDFAQISAVAARDVATSAELEANLQELYQTIMGVDLAAYDVDELKAEAPLVLREMYRLRLSLRDKLSDWQARGLVTRTAEKGLRSAFRSIRYATDMLGELSVGYDQMDPGERPYRAFSGPHNNTLVHPDFAQNGDQVTFQSGDVIVVRGLRHNSAAIARVGDVDSQFSHAGMIHIDDKGRQRVVEALIEEGATISNFEYTLAHGLGRAVLYRHRDSDIAARAADRMYQRVKASRSFGGKHIFYDFTMELDNYDELFCSKLIREGFDRASGGLVILPTYPTEFRNSPKDFLDRIGVTAEESFAPGDMELETQFHAVAEWRDYRKTSRLRLMDLVMVKLFEWMETKNYTFRPTLSIRLISLFGRLSGKLPNAIKNFLTFIIPKVPSNMTGQTIGAIAMLHKTAEPLYRELQAMENETIKDAGRPLHPLAVFKHLDEVESKARGRIGFLRAP